MDFSDFTFFKFRYTFDDVTALIPPSWAGDIFSECLLTGDYFASMGIERLDKLNKPTHEHVHLHFCLKGKVTIGAMRKRLQRLFTEKGEQRKGNVMYSLVQEDDVHDVHRFLRYAWKQGGRMCAISSPEFNQERLPPGMDIDLEIALAREEQQRMWEFNIKKHEESLRPNTKDKLFETLDEINSKTPFVDERSILRAIVDYYCDEEKSANKSTMLGFLQTALWRYDLESRDVTVDRWLNDRCR